MGIEDEALVWVNSRARPHYHPRRSATVRIKGRPQGPISGGLAPVNICAENLSPITKTPEYKYCAVNVERIADQRAAEQYVIDEYTRLKARLRESAMG
nr:hypothetical protein [Raoultella ornithinolytica]MDN3782778.1 hypothetical protein [Raoultella ornithinolytica]